MPDPAPQVVALVVAQDPSVYGPADTRLAFKVARHLRANGFGSLYLFVPPSGKRSV